MSYSAADFGVTSDNTSAEDIAALNDALTYLQGSSVATSILAGMFANGVKIMVLGGKDVNRYNPSSSSIPGYSTTVAPGINIPCPPNTIVWDPYHALIVTDAPNSSTPGVSQGVQSPAIALIHEGAHSIDPNLLADLLQPNAQYDNNAEAYAVAWEDAVAYQLGDVQRFNHTGAAPDSIVKNPTLHTVDVPNADGTYNYQEQFFQGAVTLTGGEWGTFKVGDTPWQGADLAYVAGDHALNELDPRSEIQIADGTNLTFTAPKAGSEHKIILGSSSRVVLNNGENDTFDLTSGDVVTVSGVNETFDFVPLASGASSSVTIDDSQGAQAGSGTIEVAGTNLTTLDHIIGFTRSQSTAGTNVRTLEWTDQANGTLYNFTPGAAFSSSGTMTVSGGALGDGNQIVLNNFDLKSAESSAGYLGIHLGNGAALGGGVSLTMPETIATSAEQKIGIAIPVTLTTLYGGTVQFSCPGPYLCESGADTFDFSKGPVTLSIPPGQNSITFTLIDTSGSSVPDVANLTATVMDDSGNIVSSNNLAVTFDQPGIAASTVTPDHTIYGNFAPVLDANGHYQYDAMGNVITDPNSPAPNSLGSNSAYINGIDLIGSTGNDLIVTGDGTVDAVDAQQGGNDTIHGGAGADIISAGNGNNIITGGGEANVPANSLYHDVLGAGNGNNEIYANTQVDFATALANQKTATATGQQGAFIDVGDGSNTIVGGNGNDVVFAGTGANTVVLGAGHNTFVGGVEVSSGADWWGASGNQIWGVVASSGPGFTAPAGYQGNAWNGVTIAAQFRGSSNSITQGTASGTPFGVGNDVIFGGTGDSAYYLSNGDNWLDAGGGNDTIYAGAGSSTIYGGQGNDLIYGGGGSNYINLESGNDTVVLRGGNNTVIGGTGDNQIYSGDYSNSWAASGAGSNNYIYGGSGNTQIVGSGGNDTLISGSEQGTGKSTNIFGGNGNEYIVGGNGNDELFGGAGHDTIYAGDGNTFISLSNNGNAQSTVYGGLGDDTIYGGAGNDVISAGDGNAVITASSGTSYITGGAGNDTLQGNGSTTAVDTLVAGTGTSLLQGGAGTEVMYSSIGNATLIAGSGSDTLYGGGGTDVLQGSSNASANTLFVAGSGNETIIGGAGGNTYEFDQGFGNVELQHVRAADTFKFGAGISPSDLTVTAAIGSDGNPALVIQSPDGGQVIIDGGLDGAVSQYTFMDPGTGSPVTLSLDQLMAQANSAPATVAATNGNVVFSSMGMDTLTGGTGNDTLYAWNGGNSMTAGTGNQILNSESGYDTVVGGSGNDTLVSFAGNDTLIGGTGNTTFVVNSNTDVIEAQLTGTNVNTVMTSVGLVAPANVQNLVGTGGADISLTGNDLGDTIVANSGNDTLIAGTGLATMVGGSGNDTFVVNNSADVVEAQTTGHNVNTVQSSVDFSLQTNGQGVQNLTGTGTADITLTGNSLGDTITANSGNDTLIGGSGNDTLIGGVGRDTFSMYNGMGSDVAIDTSSQGGVIQLQPGMSLSDVLMVQQGNDLLIQSIDNPNDSMTIQGYYTNPQTSWTIQDSSGAQAPVQATALSSDMQQALVALRGEKAFINQTKAGDISHLQLYGYVPQPDGTLVDMVMPSNTTLGNGFYSASQMTTSFVPSGGQPLMLLKTGGTPNFSDYWYVLNYGIYSVSMSYNGQPVFFGNYYPGAPQSLLNGGTVDATTWNIWPAQVPYTQSGYAQVTSTSSQGWGTVPFRASRTVASINVYSTTAAAPVVYADSPQTSNSTTSTMWQPVTWQYLWSAGYSWSSPVILSPGISLDSAQNYVLGSIQASEMFGTNTTMTYLGTPAGPMLASPGSLTAPPSYSWGGAWGSGPLPQALPVYYNQVQNGYNIQTINAFSGGHTIYGEYNTIVNSWSGDNTIVGGAVAFSGSGNDVINVVETVYGGTGNDVISNAGYVYGGSGNDTITGSSVVYAGSGNESISGGVVHGGSGNDTISNAYVVNGGSGNDTVTNSLYVAAGTGNGMLVNDRFVWAGSGNDTILGSDLVTINPAGAGDELIGGPATDSAYAVLNAFYAAQGIYDWYDRYTNPASPAVAQLTETLKAYETPIYTQLLPGVEYMMGWGGTPVYTSPADAAVAYNQLLANVQNSILTSNVTPTAPEQSILNSGPITPSTEWWYGVYLSTMALLSNLGSAIANGGYPPLPVLAVVDGSALQPSSAYTGTNTPVTHIAANDFAELGALMEAGLLQPTERISFDAGVMPSNLRLSWGQVTTTLSGSPTDTPSKYTTLNITWCAGTQSVQVVIPHSTDPVGAGLINFQFWNGLYSSITNLSLAQLIALAPPAPSFDPQLANFVFDPAMGAQTLPAGVTSIQFAAGIDPSQISVTQDASGNFVVSYNGGATTLTIPAADAISSPVVGTFANGANWQFVNANGGTYTYTAGSGVVYLINATGAGTVQFGAGITSGMITLGIGSLMLRVGNGTGDVLHIEGFNPQDALNSGEIQTFKFADGTSLSYAQLLSRGFDIYGTTGNETLTGTNLDNRIYAGTGNDVLIGSGAHDTLYGGAGNETMIGGAGQELMIAGSGLTTMVGGTGTNTFVINNTADVVQAQAGAANTIETSVSYTAAANVQTLTGTGTADLVLTGNDIANVITANSGNDTLVAGSGVATLVGGAGNDTFVVNNTADVVQAQAGATNTIETSVSYTASANVQNLVGIGSADITLTGNDLANVITANSGNDSLIAGSGVATLVGGTGNDTFVVNNAADVVEAQSTGSNVNTIETSVSYTASANVQNLVGIGTADITLTGNDIADTITANSGNDSLVAGSGVATLVGGAGSDTFYVNNVNDVVQAQSTGSNVNAVYTSVSYVAPANVENLIGTGAADITLTGNDIADTITANSGNDSLVVGSGVATMVGGTGSDTFYVNNVADVVEAQSTGSNVNTVYTSVSYVAPANVENLIGIGSADITLTGNDLADTLVANSGNDTLIAGSGLATMVGGTGNDSFVVNNSADLINAQLTGSNVNTAYASVDFSLATNGQNVQNLVGTGTANLTLTGNSLDNVITANSGNDTLVSLSGNDTLISGTGVDTLIGGTGNDSFYVNNSADLINAQLTGSNLNTAYASVSYDMATNAQNVQNLTGVGTADLILTGNSLDNVITANAGNDFINGGAGNDTLIGGIGANVLEDTSGNNLLTDTQGKGVLVGGAGADTLTGGGGNSFFAAGAGNDVVAVGAFDSVVAFNAGDGADTVMTAAGGANTLSLGGAISFSNLSLARNGSDLILNVAPGDSITFHDWYASAANADFTTLQIIGPQKANMLGGDLTGYANEFDFSQIVAAFDKQTANKPPLSPWNMTAALVQAHLSSSDTAALGGDLAWYYGSQGSLSGMNLAAAQTTLKDPAFGTQAQTLHTLSSVQGATVTL